MSSSRNMRRIRSICLILVIAAGVACATRTRVADRWISPEYSGGGMHKFLVIGIAQSDLTRRTYEDGFAEALHGAGADAVPSYRLLPTTDRLAREELEAVVRSNGFEGVIVTRLLEVAEETTVVPPSTYVVPSAGYGRGYGGGYYGYYGAQYEVINNPGYTRTTEIVRLETKLWKADGAQLVWGVTSETFDPTSTSDGIESVTRALTNQLNADGLVAK